MGSYKSIGVPRIRKDGGAIELGLRDERNREVSLTILTQDLERIIELLVRAYGSARITQASPQPAEEEKEEFKPTPMRLYFAIG